MAMSPSCLRETKEACCLARKVSCVLQQQQKSVDILQIHSIKKTKKKTIDCAMKGIVCRVIGLLRTSVVSNFFFIFFFKKTK